jgi:Uma2 family endonuclease
MTAEEFSRLEVDDYSDRYRFELIDGALSVREGREPASGCVLTNVGALVGSYVHSQGLGKAYLGGTSVLISPTVRAADMAFIRRERLPANDDLWLTQPDLAVETFSHSNHSRYMSQKVEHYLSVGARLIWYIDPRHVEVYRAMARRRCSCPETRSRVRT